MTGTSMTFSGPKQSREDPVANQGVSLWGDRCRSHSADQRGGPGGGNCRAVRYLHTPTSVVSLEDCENMLILARRFLQAVAAME